MREKAQETDYDDATFNLLFKMNCRKENWQEFSWKHGTRYWDDTELIADHIFSEIDESLLDNPDIIRLINAFREQIRIAPQQINKNFFCLQHRPLRLGSLAVSLLNFPYEESDHWRKEYSQATGYQKQLFEQSYEQFIKTVARGNDQQLMNYLKMDEDKTHIEIESVLSYLKLRKIHRLMIENQKDLEKEHSKEEKDVLGHTHAHLKAMEENLMKTHQHIKELQIAITEKKGTVILK
jgi:DNA primase